MEPNWMHAQEELWKEDEKINLSSSSSSQRYRTFNFFLFVIMSVLHVGVRVKVRVKPWFWPWPQRAAVTVMWWDGPKWSKGNWNGLPDLRPDVWPATDCWWKTKWHLMLLSFLLHCSLNKVQLQTLPPLLWNSPAWNKWNMFILSYYSNPSWSPAVPPALTPEHGGSTAPEWTKYTRLHNNLLLWWRFTHGI